MSQHDLVFVLQKENMPAIMINERFIEAFGILDMSHLIVIEIIKYVNWNIPEAKSQDSR
jgi:hypothetical protein